jgi:hypothetical protein
MISSLRDQKPSYQRTRTRSPTFLHTFSGLGPACRPGSEELDTKRRDELRAKTAE